MSSKKDYYDILGISKDSNASEIKKAYRKLAMKYHPDVNKEDDAEERFKEINEAYEVLSDDNKKSRYDRFGHDGVSGQGGFGGGNPFGGHPGFEDIMKNFEDVFGGDMFGGDMFGRANSPRKGQDVLTEVSITYQDAFNGTEIVVQLLDGSDKSVSVPAGIRDSMELRLKEKGQPGYNGGPNGDYFIRVFIDPIESLKRRGDDLIKKIDVNVIDALVGKKVKISLWEEETISITIPPLSDFGNLLRIKGKGFKIINSNNRGDLYVSLNPTMPKKLNKKSKEMLLEIKKELKLK